MDPEELKTALDRAVREAIRGEPRAAIAYSGGLDSSIIANFAARHAKIRCYTCAVKGSYDERNAGLFAELEGLALTTIILDPDTVVTAAGRASRVLRSNDPVKVAYTIPIVCVLDNCEERLMLTGSGADELFGGYAKYASAKDPVAMMATDLEKLIHEVEALVREAASARKRIEFPFMSGEIRLLAARIPIQEKIDRGGRKLILREMARSLGLPSHNRPKKAAQYSSGIMKEIEKIAKREGKDVSTWIADIASL